MSRSIIGSVTGNLQVYSAKSKDKLSRLRGHSGGDPDLAPITNFPDLKSSSAPCPTCKHVVPMGISIALHDVRQHRGPDAGGAARRGPQGENRARHARAHRTGESLKDHVRQIVTRASKGT